MANKPHFQWAVRANYGGTFAPTIDGEECVKLWFTVGNSLPKVAQILAERGQVNPSTGMPVTRDAVAKAAWKWMLNNPHKAMDEHIKPLCKATGIEFSEDAFWENYVAHCFSYLGQARRAELIKEHNLEDIAKVVGERREKHLHRRRRVSR